MFTKFLDQHHSLPQLLLLGVGTLLVVSHSIFAQRRSSWSHLLRLTNIFDSTPFTSYSTTCFSTILQKYQDRNYGLLPV